AQYEFKPRTGLKDWGKFSGAVVDVQFGRRQISCGICGGIAEASPQAFACHVVSDDAVKEAIALIG
ncbi:hypothetical protein, partial [Roseibium sp.]|uniref:hypothetical protein n=1 Tax=Roseibium sp. TaxID=1936156 RepID=UPI001B05BAA3